MLPLRKVCFLLITLFCFGCFLLVTLLLVYINYGVSSTRFGGAHFVFRRSFLVFLCCLLVRWREFTSKSAKNTRPPETGGLALHISLFLSSLAT